MHSQNKTRRRYFDSMRRILLICLFAFSFNAQSQLKFGLTVGGNYNLPAYSASGDTLSGFSVENSMGFHGGIYSAYHIGKDMMFSVQSELLFSTRSHNTYSSSEYLSHENISYFSESYARQNMMYVDMPIHFRYNYVMQKGRYGDANMASVMVGPQVGWALGSDYFNEQTNVITVQGQSTTTRRTTETANYKFVPLDYGISAGLQMEFQMGLRFGARFYRAFSSASDNDPSDLKINNQMLLFFVGFNFPSN